MLYHAILQLSQKAKQTKRGTKGGNQIELKKLVKKQTKKIKSQYDFNNKNTIARRKELQKMVNSTKIATMI
jgi:hypothetical protein